MKYIKSDSVPIFCSIGENCLGQGVLDRLKITSSISPFSWARSNIDYILEIISEDFRDFLNPDFVKHQDRYGKLIPTNNKYSCANNIFEESVASNFEFTHHDILNSEKDRDSYQRKVSRFRELILSNKSLTFLYHYRFQPTERRNLNYIMDRLNIFNSTISKKRNAPTSVLCFTQEIVSSDEQRGISCSKYGSCDLVVFKTRTIWGGKNQDVFWGKVDDDLFEKIFSQYNTINFS